MKTRNLIAAVSALFVVPIAFGQYGNYSQPMPQQASQSSSGGQQKTTTTTTKKVMPVGVKGYLDDQLAHSNDKKFHVSLNGKDLALTPVNFHQEQKLGGNKGMTAVDMKAADGKTYEIDFMTSGSQVTGAKVGKVGGK
ncbi:MAG TPA: hypothetical protein VLK27_08010 [Chthoniobacterales bacterium]|nr:hypothetical protein [Chthoniobacterales bacterium]